MAPADAQAGARMRESIEREFEVRDAPPRAVTMALFGLFVGITLSGAIVAGIVALLSSPHTPPYVTAIETADRTPPPPRLEVTPAIDRAAIEAAAAARLTGYAWVDRTKGTARIPIARAMALLAKQGWPDGKGSASP